jgi:serine/threonine-protein kinase
MPLPSDLLCARIVVQRGLATEERVRECLELQAKNRAVGYDESLHAVLLKRGFLSGDDARSVERDLALAQFARAERVFARICAEKGVATAEALKDLLQRQRDEGYRVRIGEALIEAGNLTRASRDAIAAEQVKRLEEEDEAARQAEANATPGPAPTPAAALPRPATGRLGPSVAPEDADLPVSRRVGEGTDVALAAFRRDQRKFGGSGEHAPVGNRNAVQIEGYDLVSRLGQGSVGVVWKARPKAGGPVVGLKVLSPSLTRNPELLARFQKAYERAQGIEHPALVQLGPLARSGDLWYYIMELVEGETLGERVERGGPLSAAKARDVAREVARGLAHVHGQRVLHGGLRPSNVLLGRDGSVKIADLILARIAPRLSGEASTDEARLYASPEELTGAAGADPRDDVYSFGLILYFALVGRHAFPDAQTSARLMGAVDPRDVEPSADAALSDVVVRATQPAREGRYRDAHELLSAIEPSATSERFAKNQESPPLEEPARSPTLELAPGELEKLGGAVNEPAATRAMRERDAREGAEPPQRAPEVSSPLDRLRRSGEMPTVPPQRRSGREAAEPPQRTVPRTLEVPAPLAPAREAPRRRRTSVPLPGSPGADLTGQVVSGRYRILDKLGEGGMGVVYRAEHTIMGKTVAFKVLHPSLVKSEESIARFQREVMAMAQFAHRNVVRIFDAGKTEDGRLYMAMELVDGRDLARLLEEQERVPAARTVQILRQILRAVGEGHAKNIVHRDLKPENVLLAQGPAGEEVVKVMDFGIAKILEQDEDQPVTPGMFRTMERIVLGTPEYMSPEQASGSPIDSRSDLYSLGVITYEMLLGRLPFDADSPVGFIGKHIVDPPLTFDEARPGHGLSPALEAFVMKALEKDPQERFQSAEEMLRALEEAAPREAAEAAAQSVEARALAERNAAASGRKHAPSPVPQPAGTGRKAAPAASPDPSRPAASSQPAKKGDAAKKSDAKAPVAGSRAGLFAGVLAGVLLLAGGVTTAVVLARRVPFGAQLDAAKVQADAAIKTGDYKRANAVLAELLGTASDENKPAVQTEIDRVARLESEARDLAVKKGRFADAVQAVETILKGKDLSQESALAQAVSRARGEQYDPAAVAELEKRSRKWRTSCHRELGEQLMNVPSALTDARDQLRAARETAEDAEQRDIDGKLLDIEALLDEDRARKALDAGSFDEAERLAVKALKHKETPERAALVERIRKKSAEVEGEQRHAKVSRYLDEGAAFEKDERFADARARYEAAEAEAGHEPEIAALRETAHDRIAAVARAAVAVDAYSGLAPLANATSRDGKQKAIDAREAYVAKFPDGPRTARVRSELDGLKRDVASGEKMKASAALDKAAADVAAALAAKDEAAARAALDAARKAAATLGTPEASAVADKLASDVELAAALGHALEKDFVAVPEGKAPEGFTGTVRAFWIGTSEVTNNQYYEFCETIVQAAKADLDAAKAKNDAALIASAQAALDAAYARWPDGWTDIGEKEERLKVFPGGQGAFPVASVSFPDAVAFCEWKTARDGKPVHLRFRLPHEVEWERAARGDDARKYPWGNDWVDGNAAGIGAPLAECDPVKWAKGKSPFGAIHMSGNVAEWVDDLYVNKNGTKIPDSRCAKGGSFRTFTPEGLQVTGVASRERFRPIERKEWVGFRILAEVAKD